MNEKLHSGHSPEGEHIDIGDPGDIRRWSHELRVDERTLRVAVLEAGSLVTAVKHYLSTSRKQV